MQQQLVGTPAALGVLLLDEPDAVNAIVGRGLALQQLGQSAPR